MEKINGKRAQNRRKIMHAAKGLFEQHGIDNVTFNDIAKEAEVCRTTVFNHFSSNDDLRAALLEQEVDDIFLRAEELPLEGTAKVSALFDQLIEDTANYPLLTFRLIQGAITGGRAGESIRKVSTYIEDHLPGEDADRKRLQTTAIVGAYYGLINQYILRGQSFDVPKMQGEYHQILDMLIKEE